jgi:hypothetical protein
MKKLEVMAVSMLSVAMKKWNVGFHICGDKA